MTTGAPAIATLACLIEMPHTIYQSHEHRIPMLTGFCHTAWRTSGGPPAALESPVVYACELSFIALCIVQSVIGLLYAREDTMNWFYILQLTIELSDFVWIGGSVLILYPAGYQRFEHSHHSECCRGS